MDEACLQQSRYSSTFTSFRSAYRGHKFYHNEQTSGHTLRQCSTIVRSNPLILDRLLANKSSLAHNWSTSSPLMERLRFRPTSMVWSHSWILSLGEVGPKRRVESLVEWGRPSYFHVVARIFPKELTSTNAQVSTKMHVGLGLPLSLHSII